MAGKSLVNEARQTQLAIDLIQHGARLQLLEATQGVAYEGYERSIDAHIKNLRAKLEENPRQPRYLETVFGVGYRLPRDKS